MIKNGKVTEIFIVNFEVVDFEDEHYSGVTFKVYRFEDFIEMLKSNLPLPK